MTKRKTIGENPLDAVVPAGPITAPAPRAGRSAASPSLKKARMTFHLPVEVIERAKNAVYWTPGLTLADLAAQALTEALDRLEKKRGGPFPPRKAPLKGGRPIK